MQLQDLVKPISQQSDEELLERMREMRTNRTTARPAAKAHAKRSAAKGQQGRMKKVESLLDGLSVADRAMLLEQLGGEA